MKAESELGIGARPLPEPTVFQRRALECVQHLLGELVERGADRARVSPSLLSRLFEEGAQGIQMVVLEKVGGITGQSASAAFTFGYSWGLVEGVLAALRLPVALITPQAWKKSAGLVANKGAARECAMRLWPAHAHLFARVKDDGRAEAALIARHGWLSIQRGAA